MLISDKVNARFTLKVDLEIKQASYVAAESL